MGDRRVTCLQQRHKFTHGMVTVILTYPATWVSTGSLATASYASPMMISDNEVQLSIPVRVYAQSRSLDLLVSFIAAPPPGTLWQCLRSTVWSLVSGVRARVSGA